jgi:hypothetical protein
MGRKGAAAKKPDKKVDKKADKKADKKGKKGAPVPAPAPEPDGSSDEEDPLGNQDWAKTNEADFSSGVDDLFADLLSMKDDFDKNTPDELKNAKMSKLGEDTAAAEAEEKKKEEEAAAKVKAEEEETERRRIRKEKRDNMSPEAKKAKMKCNVLKAQAKSAHDKKELADNDAYEKALTLMEEEEWEAAETELKNALGKEPEPELEPEPEPEPEPELSAEEQRAKEQGTAAAKQLEEGGGACSGSLTLEGDFEALPKLGTDARAALEAAFKETLVLQLAVLGLTLDDVEIVGFEAGSIVIHFKLKVQEGAACRSRACNTPYQ